MATKPGGYYIPPDSKYPVLVAGGAGLMLLGLALSIMSPQVGLYRGVMALGFLALVATVFYWFSAVISEHLDGKNNDQMNRSYVWGMSWFIFSEVMFFAGFFGALFYVRVFAVPWLGGEGEKGLSGDLWPEFSAAWPLMSNPDPELAGPGAHMSWPGLSALLGWLPLWNTIFLVSSSFTLTLAHHGLRADNRNTLKLWLIVTIVLAVAFLILQTLEYMHAYDELGLTLGSGIYGSTFFILTGFHGAHVTLGTIMLITTLARIFRGHFKPQDHFGFEATAWYWHFVDVVWVMLFLFVYIF